MTLSRTLRAADEADNAAIALAIAAILNADQFAKKALKQEETFDVASVRRLARIVAEYVDAPPPVTDYRQPSKRASEAGLAAVSQAVAAE